MKCEANLKPEGRFRHEVPFNHLISRRGFLAGAMSMPLLAGAAYMRGTAARIGLAGADANPYQTEDGALWMLYCGAWNQGVGRFDPNATSIADCMGNESSLDAGSVGDNRMWREPTSVASIGPSETLGRMIYDRVFTVLFIGRAKKRTVGAQDCFAFYNGAARGVSLNITNQHELSPFLYRAQFSGGSITPTWDTNDEITFAFCFSFDGTDRVERYREIGGVTRDYTLASSSALYDRFVPSNLSFGYATKCEIAAFAVYSRAITQTEFENFWAAAKNQYHI